MSDAHARIALEDVIQGRRGWYMPGGKLLETPVAICAGSFNPLHPAHIQLLGVGEKKAALPGLFELSITNVDKPPLDMPAIEKRIAQFSQQGLKLVLTNRPRYLGKIQIFPPGSFFVMGSDTFERVIDPRYYQPDECPLEMFESSGAGFVVAARRNSAGAILTGEMVLQSTQDADRWAKLTRCISPDEFLIDMSSSAIRKAASHS